MGACGCASQKCRLCFYRLFCGCFVYFALKCWTFLQEADTDPTGEAAHKTQQTLTFYELDLGLNHVVRKYSEPLEEHANFLVSVPGGNDGPSGVLICSENYLTYKNLGDQHDIRCPIPRRRVMFISMLRHDYSVPSFHFCGVSGRGEVINEKGILMSICRSFFYKEIRVDNSSVEKYIQNVRLCTVQLSVQLWIFLGLLFIRWAWDVPLLFHCSLITFPPHCIFLGMQLLCICVRFVFIRECAVLFPCW